MRIMNCPLNGPRNISEFVCFGEVREVPDPVAASDREWTAYLFLENNSAGIVDEWWLHAPTAFCRACGAFGFRSRGQASRT